MDSQPVIPTYPMGPGFGDPTLSPPRLDRIETPGPPECLLTRLGQSSPQQMRHLPLLHSLSLAMEPLMLWDPPQRPYDSVAMDYILTTWPNNTSYTSTTSRPTSTCSTSSGDIRTLKAFISACRSLFHPRTLHIWDFPRTWGVSHHLSCVLPLVQQPC